MARRLEGRVALITGGSGGVGAATVRAFAREGADAIAVHYASARDRAEALVAEVEKVGRRALAVQADVSRPDEARRLVQEVVDAFGRLDVLVCYAGHPFRRKEWFAPLEELTEEVLLGPLRVDLLGSVYCVQAAAPHLRASARGRVVLVSSTPALRGDTVGISYLLAKGGLLSLTKALALSLGPDGVHVNCLALGSISTEAMGVLTEQEVRELEEETALGRTGTPEEVARKAVFLASDDADFLTGTTLVVDGGFGML